MLKPMCMRPPCTNAEVKIRYHCEGWAQMIAGYMQKLPGARAVLMVQSLGAQSPATYTSALSENTIRVPIGSASHQAATEAPGPASDWMLLCIARGTQPLRIAACAPRPQSAPTPSLLPCSLKLVVETLQTRLQTGSVFHTLVQERSLFLYAPAHGHRTGN